MAKSTNRNHGFNVKSLSLLLKTVVLTKLNYAAPLWLDKNLGTYKDFWNKIIMKISGATLYPNRDLVELAIHVPPLHIQLEILMIKFLCKAMSSHDHVTATLIQMEGSLYKEFHY